jgi:hypothetical protein
MIGSMIWCGRATDSGRHHVIASTTTSSAPVSRRRQAAHKGDDRVSVERSTVITTGVRRQRRGRRKAAQRAGATGCSGGHNTSPNNTSPTFVGEQNPAGDGGVFVCSIAVDVMSKWIGLQAGDIGPPIARKVVERPRCRPLRPRYCC